MATEPIVRPLSNSEELIYLISGRLADCIRQCAGERAHPMRGVDSSDDFIKEMEGKIKDLRRIRQELETNLYGDAGV